MVSLLYFVDTIKNFKNYVLKLLYALLLLAYFQFGQDNYCVCFCVDNTVVSWEVTISFFSYTNLS